MTTPAESRTGRETLHGLLDDLAEEAAARLTSEQLFAVAARVAARELRPLEVAPARPFDLGAAVALDLDAGLCRDRDRWREIGIDDDLIAAWLLPALVRAGIRETHALAALERHTGWRPRSDAKRSETVARQMIDDGFTRDEVRTALRSAR